MNPPRTRMHLALAVLATTALGCDGDVPSPGVPSGPDAAAITVAVVVFGTESDPDGYEVVVVDADLDVVATRAVDAEGGTVVFTSLEAGSYTVNVVSVDDPCVAEGEPPRSPDTDVGTWRRVQIVISCLGPDVSALYERTGAYRLDRFILHDDGTFVLDAGTDEESGTYTLAEGAYRFDFAIPIGAGESTATGTLRDGCMDVEYSPALALSDYRGGEYCSVPDPRG